MEKKHYNIKVYGRVQGVFYRGATRTQARYMGLKGFVMNKIDGSVYIEVEGPVEVLAKFVAWCKVGPPHADVSHIEVNQGEIVPLKSFGIR